MISVVKFGRFWFQILNTTEKTIAMSIGGFKTTGPKPYLRIVVGRLRANVKAVPSMDGKNLSESVPQFEDANSVLSVENQNDWKLSEPQKDEDLAESSKKVKSHRALNSSGEQEPDQNRTVPTDMAVWSKDILASNNLGAIPLNMVVFGTDADEDTTPKSSGKGQQRAETRLPFQPDHLRAYDRNARQQYYITAEFPPDQLKNGMVFVLGDGRYYGRYASSKKRVKGEKTEKKLFYLSILSSLTPLHLISLLCLSISFCRTGTTTHLSQKATITLCGLGLSLNLGNEPKQLIRK